MTGEMTNLRGLLEKSAGADLLRKMIGFAVQRLAELEVGGLTSASGHVDSPLGTVSSDWTRKQGRFTLRVTVPAGATATVFVPTATRRSVTGPAGAHLETVSGGYAKFTTGSGTYVFSSVG